MGKRGEWTRWGRNGCEGWSLAIGGAFRASVIRRDTAGEPTVWEAEVNAARLGKYPERELAMARVEESIELDMKFALEIGNCIEQQKRSVRPMCNLYSMTKSQAAIIAITRAMRDKAGNLPPLPGIFPDYFAPIVRNAPDGVRELAMARWGMPGPPAIGGAAITNIRNVKSPALARLAKACKPLRRAVDFVLRVRRHEAAQDADVVCA